MRMEIKRKEDRPAFESDHGETVWELIGRVASQAETKHSFAICEIEPGAASRLHYHPVCEESYYITAGIAKMVIDDEEKQLRSGDSILISPEQKHQIFNVGDKPLTFIAVCVPPWTPDCSVFLD